MSKDSPDEEKYYMLLGDLADVKFRFATFYGFPTNSPVNSRDLADAGFYYLGRSDRVKCFSCHLQKEDWKAGDDAKSYMWHKDDCKFRIGKDQVAVAIDADPNGGNEEQPSSSTMNNNVPINVYAPENSTVLSYEEQLKKHDETFLSAINTTATSRMLPETGFFYFGTKDKLSVPYSNPANPMMRHTEDRLKTFDAKWPATNITATPRTIAEAGFYFIGKGDSVKCWCCGIGLRNWEPNDDPWTEHARWSPICEFLLQKKGVDFVRRVTSQRPSLSYPSVLMNLYERLGRNPGTSSNISPSNRSSVNTDKEFAEAVKALKKILLKLLVQQGYSTTVAERVLHEWGVDLREFQVVSEVLELAKQNNLMTDSCVCSTHEKNQEISQTIAQNKKVEELISQLEAERRCKVCLDNPADVVFMPCGHLACCSRCACLLESCPICRRKVDQAVKTYL